MGYSASLRVFGAEDASLFEALLGLGTEFLSCVVGTVVIVSLSPYSATSNDQHTSPARLMSAIRSPEQQSVPKRLKPQLVEDSASPLRRA